jgi:hypothetical protein
MAQILVTMPRDRGKAHLFEQLAERLRIRRGVLDELEAVGADGVVPRLNLHICLLWSHAKLRGRARSATE